LNDLSARQKLRHGGWFAAARDLASAFRRGSADEVGVRLLILVGVAISHDATKP